MKTVRLGDCVEKVATWNPIRASSNEQFKYIDIGAVNQQSKQIDGAQLIVSADAPSRARQLVAVNDVLVSTVRPNLNAVAKVLDNKNKATASTGFCVLRANNKIIDPNYLFNWVKSDLFVNDMVKKATGASYPAVSDKIIFDSNIKLPPLAEQKRIAAILDKAAEIKTKREQAIAKLDQLAQSAFLDMFGDPVRNNKKWPVANLGGQVFKLGSGSTPTGGDSSYKDSGISLIRSLNVHDGVFVFKNLAFIDDVQAAKLANVVVEDGDVLLNITGASVARVCRVPASALPARVNQHVMIIRPKHTLNSIFLERLLLSVQMKTKLLRIGGSGATREAITKAQAERLEIILPPIDLQNKFARFINKLDDIKRGYLLSSNQINCLSKSLQHQAFIIGFNA